VFLGVFAAKKHYDETLIIWIDGWHMSGLTVTLLGPLIVEINRQPVAFPYEKLRALLAYLCAEPSHPFSRGRLAGLLWPDQPQQAAQESLRQALSRLRAAINDRAADPPFLLVDHGGAQINPASGITVDLWTFQDLLGRTAAHHHRSVHSCLACAALLEKAAGLVRGPFLQDLHLPDSDLFESWAQTFRERINNQSLELFGSLSEIYERRADHDQARKYAQRQIEIDPYHEAAHRLIMRSLVRAGMRSQAAAHFNQLRQLLADELGIIPEDETTALFQSIRQGQALPGPAAAPAVSLPAPLSPLVGRVVELSELCHWLSDPDRRLISVTGPGGVGKTRLVVQAVSQAAAIFADGAVFVPLTTEGGSTGLVRAIAVAARLPSAADPFPALVAHLQPRETLLVIDGFEHALEERVLLNRLLEACPRLVILTTSRQRLNLSGEWVFALGGLEVPPPSITDRLEAYSAVLLFCQCARRANQHFQLDDPNRAAVGEICRLTGGIPLAIQLAAAWTRSLPCHEIAREIRRSLDFLGQPEGPEAAHSSVRAVFNQTWQKIDAQDQAVFARLAVFRGGFDRAAAEAVAGARIDHLARFVDQSLLPASAEGRYDLHDLLRQFGMEKLREAGEEPAARQRHFDYYYQLAQQHQNQLRQSNDLSAFLWFALEAANLNEALAWAAEAEAEPERSAQLSVWMHPHWHQTGLHKLTPENLNRRDFLTGPAGSEGE
jgi:DNA-binding SARP family transcriptional activator/predicted ATPase